VRFCLSFECHLRLRLRLLIGYRHNRVGERPDELQAFGFELARIAGSHHIFEHPDVPELVSLQNRKGKAKPYQIKQFLELVEQYNLGLGDDE
jgi:predicted RNA binding protein YcfA (HicA-like mRNA interferase family)